jgi:hypothetical protein
MILWIGLALVLVYIFASHGILTSVFSKPATTATPGPALTLKDFGGTNTGNGQSNTNNQGSAKTTIVV